MGLLLFADVIAQWALPGGEMPVGIVTAVIGAPFLLILMRRTGG
jgi:iron complex transport system permease protein